MANVKGVGCQIQHHQNHSPLQHTSSHLKLNLSKVLVLVINLPKALKRVEFAISNKYSHQICKETKQDGVANMMVLNNEKKT
jgi:hypothetical protein